MQNEYIKQVSNSEKGSGKINQNIKHIYTRS